MVRKKINNNYSGIIRQGDVVLIPSTSSHQLVKRKDKILAYGEISGHHHQFALDSPVQVYGTVGASQFCEVNEDSILMHEEHHHLTIPKNRYEIRIARELDLVGEVRNVAD